MAIESDWTWADGLTLGEAIDRLLGADAPWDELRYSWRGCGGPHISRINISGDAPPIKGELNLWAGGTTWGEAHQLTLTHQLTLLFRELADPAGGLLAVAFRRSAQDLEDTPRAIPYVFWRSPDELLVIRPGQIELAGVRWLDPRLSLRAAPKTSRAGRKAADDAAEIARAQTLLQAGTAASKRQAADMVFDEMLGGEKERGGARAAFYERLRKKL